MGCASWRVHYRVREYRDLAPSGSVIHGGPANSPWTKPPNAFGLNEVGVTDSVMMSLWRFGPKAATFAVSQGAEANHLGADIAIMHSTSRRLLLYQAKLAKLNKDRFRLKSPVTASQANLLLQKSVTLNGIQYAVTGRLALYQVDITPYIYRCIYRFVFAWPYWWPWVSSHRKFVPNAQVGRDYYVDMLVGCRCSPSGVLAAPATGPAPIDSVPESQTWPWEFFTYGWLHRTSPLDTGPDSNGRPIDQEGTNGEPPAFEAYRSDEGQTQEGATALVRELADQLRLPENHSLYLVVI
jgi:hypothetical protein